ncbi:hypothetical protein ACIBI4_27280 [Streptomyces sp. NPDC050418]|uniref:hypothetical protein n=1 Tax=Streptomyces sp. NPDC050418 TaxID=3365612 RepID=UPI0037B50D13
MAAVAVLGAALVGCAVGGDDTAGEPVASVAPAAAGEEPGVVQPEEPESEAPSPGPEKVRDAFAGLQATLDDTCTPGAGNCAYYLGRVHDELLRVERAMRHDPKGAGHFSEPLAWIKSLRATLGGDTSTGNLEAHMDELTDVRDRINVWMQDHPDDYR